MAVQQEHGRAAKARLTQNISRAFAHIQYVHFIAYRIGTQQEPAVPLRASHLTALKVRAH
jgi:hypothetical protein